MPSQPDKSWPKPHLNWNVASRWASPALNEPESNPKDVLGSKSRFFSFQVELEIYRNYKWLPDYSFGRWTLWHRSLPQSHLFPNPVLPRLYPKYPGIFQHRFGILTQIRCWILRQSFFFCTLNPVLWWNDSPHILLVISRPLERINYLKHTNTN